MTSSFRSATGSDDNGRCQDCPADAICDSGTTTETLVPDASYYRFSTTATTMYPCPYPDNCLGGNHNMSMMCTKGSTGPLCALCKPDYHHSENKCEVGRDV